MPEGDPTLPTNPLLNDTYLNLNILIDGNAMLALFALLVLLVLAALAKIVVKTWKVMKGK